LKVLSRREEILFLVQDRKKVTVDELSGRTGASKETIRRDLSQLAEQGLIRKVHGSALWPEVPDEGTFLERLAVGRVEKTRIGERAASLFARGDSIFVDTGTTTLAFAEALASKSGITVITNSLLITQALGRGKGDNKVYMLGGEYHSDAEENVGPLAIEQVSRFNAHHAVITVGAITNEGILDYDIEEVEVAKAMIQRAKIVTVVADSSKFASTALFLVADWAGIDRLVVDKAPEHDIMEALNAHNVELIVAD